MKVAAVIAVRNGADTLLGCLAAVRAQRRPVDAVILAVGPSSDDTAAIARSLADPSTMIIDNPPGDRASGINVALDRTDADIVALVDAQARIADDYILEAIESLERHGADVVGGPMRPVGRTAIGRAMAAALRSPFGIGDSQFHFAGSPREVESVYLGVYRMGVFDRVGRYNSGLLRTEDDDMNARIRAAGMRIWLDPAIRSTYLCRDSLGQIWRQYEAYGYWKIALATLRPRAIRLRHFVPAAFVLALGSAALVSIVAWPPAFPALVLIYATAAWFAALFVRGGGNAARVLFPIVTFTMHSAYGVGSIRGALSWSRLRKVARRGES